MNKVGVIFICLAGISGIMGCKLIKIEVSEKRNQNPLIVRPGNNIEVTSTGTTRISGSDFFPSGFRIKGNNKIIYIDPLALNDTGRADYIFITHQHLDHFSIKDIKKVLKPETIIICPESVADKLRRYDFIIKTVKPGDSIDLDDNLNVDVVAAYNLHNALLWLKAHPKSKQYAGYVLNIDSIRIYHTGDSDYVPEMESIMDINLILVPIGGDNLTMNAGDASRLVNHIKPEFAVPMHYETGDINGIERFRILVDRNTSVLLLQ
jgi:L-ascorbate metabolism protein UlaG (beta-lactamase superfamily)